jgi:hypothetical protein
VAAVTTASTPEGFEITACRSCGRAVIWAVTRHRRLMPVDAEPVENGTITLLPGPYRREPVAVIVQGPGLIPQGLRTSHFATCPDADEWRRRKVPGG